MPISYVYTGQPMNGTENDDFMIGFKGSTTFDNNTINGNGGDDWVMADSSDTWIPNASYVNGSIPNAFNLETLVGTWTTSENPLFGDYTIPHTTVIAETTIGQSEYYRVAVGAGQTITIDLDFGPGSPVGVPHDMVVELQDGLGNIIATADDSLVTDGGLGSFPSTPGSASSYDSYLTYTLPSAGTYFINVRPFGGGPGSTFDDNYTFVMNVSVTGHAVNATNPVMGDDTINGGEGNDYLFGQGGADTINGDNGDDYIAGGSGIDAISGGIGNDTLYGGDGTEESVHGNEGDDRLISGGEGHYFGDAGNDIVFAGLTSGINEILDGGADIDTLDTTTWNGTYNINLVTGATNFGESFTNFENVITGNGTDTITGTGDANTISTQGGADTIDGAGGDDVIAGGADGDTMDGGAGFDTLSYRLSNAFVSVSLATNTASGGHANGDSIVNFEAVWGSVLGDTLVGDGAHNELSGFEGNDTIDGGGGNDTIAGGLNADNMDGGAGFDTLDYRLSSGGVTVSLTTNSASGGDASGDTIVNFEAVWGSNQADTLTGDATNNQLRGFNNNDTLDGGAGADTLIGGLGNDIYVVDNAGDIVSELVGEGSDTVQASVTFTLSANVESLALTGGGAINAFGNVLDNVINGNGANNQLNGFDGADTLDGGAGADSMFGGNGNDLYLVDNAGDLTTEVSALGGLDTVVSTVNRNLTANIENLSLMGAALTGSGNGLNNIIVGNANANTLYGFDGADRLDGGTGADTLFGANGDDVYVVDNVGDITVEGSPAGGIDTVESSISRNLNANFENLVLTGGGANTGYGNVLNNYMAGNGAANSLYGFDGADTLDGGGGADQMFGGNGNDNYIVDDAGDVTSETSPAGGVDTVLSAVTRNLTTNLENLILIGVGVIDGAGNALNNIITGNNSVNTLFGLDGADTLDGGLGADTLQGGAGADTYVFSSGLGGGNVDQINGFNVADDTIDLDHDIFSALSVGALSVNAFHIGAGAGDVDDRIIYDSSTGALYYDADGTGAAAAIQFATLAAGLALTNNDFVII